MFASFSIRSAAGRYRVEIARGLLQREVGTGASIVLCDERFRGRVDGGGRRVITIAANEQAKSLDAIPRVITALREQGVTRNAHLIAVGGGVVQDIASFAASIYMRGIAWDYFPTTLLAMADSCIGGKSSINVGAHKNLVGTFHPPRAVLIDPAFTRSLSAEQRVAGLCEAVKICFARGPRTFAAYLACRPGVGAGAGALVRVVALSLRTKKWFVEIDEFDRAERQLLNFGHTFGHAIESGSGFAIAHGVAVGIGMLCAIEFARQRGSVDAALPAVARLAQHVRELLAAVPGLAGSLRALAVDTMMASFLADKKHGPAQFVLILPDRRGRLERARLARDDAHHGQIRRIFAELRQGLPA